MNPADDIQDDIEGDIQEAAPGLARERTELAWTRTTISFAAVGGAILKSAPVAGLAVLISSIVIWELGRLPRAAGTGRSEARLRLVTATITTIALAALALTLLRW